MCMYIHTYSAVTLQGPGLNTHLNSKAATAIEFGWTRVVQQVSKGQSHIQNALGDSGLNQLIKNMYIIYHPIPILTQNGSRI
jgi:hypothetical protein